MKRLLRTSSSRLRLAIWIIASLILLLAFFLFVPVFVALRAGIAGLSLALFTPLLLTALFLAFAAWHRHLTQAAVLASLATTVALLSIVAVQMNFVTSAQREQASLSFNPVRYLTFTGDSIRPSRTFVYKEVAGQPLRLAVYGAHSAKPAATVLLVHGGGWQYGDYLRTNNWPELLTEQGYRVISIEYRLATPASPTWDKAPTDINDAVSYIKQHASQLGVQTDRMALLGQSAGGHLALLEAYRSQSVKAVVGLYAPTDLAEDYRLSTDKDSELAFLGGTPEQVPRRYEATSVQRAISSAAPATLLIQGLSDDLVSYTSSVNTSRKLHDAGIPYRLVLLPYTGHSFENQVGGFATQIGEQVVIEFLADILQ